MSVETRLILSPGPHLHPGLSTKEIMWWVNASLFPVFAWGVTLFGGRVIVLLVSGIVGSLAAEYFVNFLRRQKQTLFDGSAVLTGILLVGTLSPGLPLWMPAAGGFAAVLFGKMVFGGLGHNIFNPALIGRAFLMAAFPVAMTTTWLKPFDAVTMATPLNLLKLEGVQNSLYQNLFFGVRAGSVGETSIFLILLGAAILLWKGIIRFTIPLSVIAGFLLAALFSKHPLFQLMTGGLWFGAFFMATDYVTAPMTPKGQIIFGLGIGILTAVIRLKGGYPEGICYAILIMNAVTPALNRWFKPKRPSWEGGVP